MCIFLTFTFSTSEDEFLMKSFFKTMTLHKGPPYFATSTQASQCESHYIA